MKKINVYVDMDGVIADFNGEVNALERFKNEKGFFKKLKPMNENGMKKIIKNFNTFIISISPNEQADKDKREWLKQFFPEIKDENIIIVRDGKRKVDYMKTENGILLDDYGKNCREWNTKKDNFSIKVVKPLEEYYNELIAFK